MKINIDDIAKGRITKKECEALLHYFEDGGHWQGILNLSDRQLEELYNKGKEHYEKEEFDDALFLFSSLIQMNPYLEHHWLALGATLHRKEQYKEALTAYELGLSLNEESITALFLSAQAAWRMDDRVLCKEYLEKVVKIKATTEEERQYVEQAYQLKGRVQ